MESDGKDQTCADFVRGRCNRGDDCKYIHEVRDKSEDVCNDFTRGKCTRGSSCRFKHVGAGERSIPVCKDYQLMHGGCNRSRCKFLHLTEDEEAHFRMTGDLPAHRGDPDRVKQMGFMNPATKANHCKDFIRGTCSRGPGCRFRHATERELDLESQMHAMQSHIMPPMMGGGGGEGIMGSGPMPYGKRRREESGGMGEDNDGLRRKITSLQKEVTEMRKLVDDLYQQNTKYRQRYGTLDGTTAPSYGTPSYATSGNYAEF